MTDAMAWPQWRSRDLDVATPMPVVEMATVERNITRLQRACDAAGVANRPHIKTHKSIAMARLQLAAGAVGLTCQKLGEAEVMADAGFDDILISYNILGSAKLKRLSALAARVKLAVSCDNVPVADGLSGAMADADAPLAVLVECDTGRNRCGVVDPAVAADLAGRIAALPGLRFAGLLVYPPNGPPAATRAFVDEVRRLCAARDLTVETVSAGGTPNIERIGEAGETEYRSGTSIYNDRQMVELGAAAPEDCAVFVHATVVSRPAPGRAMIDAGSKALTSDLAGFKHFGLLVDYPCARLYQLAEEHGFVDLADCPASPEVGEVVRILPNHVCPVSNLFDRIALVRDGRGAGMLTIDARGKVA
ncbi:alanine racemase [Nitratireductor arenosus]|nr:alanine racemase [Nitratireductor arenosus]